MKDSKKTIAGFLLFAIALKMLLAPAIFLDFELRKDFIIKNYCVNKYRPALNCDGKCYLAKQIKNTQQEDERQATNRFVFEFFGLEILFNNSSYKNIFSTLIQKSLSTENNFYNYSNYFHTRYGSIFHPPKV
jgi:hypothetical protein